NKIPAMYIDSLIENSATSMELLKPVRLGDLHSFLLNNDGFVISHVTPLETRIESDGASVFSGHNNQSVGRIDAEETKGLNLITQTNKGGVISFYINNHLMEYSIDRSKSSIKIDTTDQDNLD